MDEDANSRAVAIADWSARSFHRPRRPHRDDAPPRRRSGRDVLREHERITRERAEGARRRGGKDDGRRLHGVVRVGHEGDGLRDRAAARVRRARGRAAYVRVGLNAGEPIEEDGDLFGSTVILASRIAAKAEGGEILVPEPCAGSAPERLPLRRPRRVRRQGVRGPGAAVRGEVARLTNTPRIQYCRTSEGVDLAYFVIGHGPPLLWVSTIFTSHLAVNWNHRQKEFLDVARYCTIIKYDGRGCGLSDREATDFLCRSHAGYRGGEAGGGIQESLANWRRPRMPCGGGVRD